MNLRNAICCASRRVHPGGRGRSLVKQFAIAAGCLLLMRASELLAQAPPAAAHFGAPVPLAESMLPPPPAERSIDLETALAIAGADNPTIALAREAVQASLAELLQARAQLLPTLDTGMDFNLHRGPLQSAPGVIQQVDRQSLYAGAGAEAVGAGTVGVPGVRLSAHVAEAWFDPKAARQVVLGRQLDALAIRNSVLLEVTSRFFALMGAEAKLQAARQSEKEALEVVRLTAAFARTGQGRKGDADRAATEAALLGNAVLLAQEEVAVAGADLTRVLSLDPSLRLRVPDRPIPLITLVNPQTDLESLIQIALSNRPEIAARGAEVAAAEIRLRQERARPWLPRITVAISAGEFGGGSNLADTSFGHFNGRTDLDAIAVWSLQNLGLGNLALQRRQRALLGIAEEDRARIIDQVRREVADAHALSAARLRQVNTARSEANRAELAFREDLLSSRNLAGVKPIETLRSLTLLASARQALIAALVGYNQAQFQLFVALGQPPVVAPLR